jgi:hypothetical protein
VRGAVDGVHVKGRLQQVMASAVGPRGSSIESTMRRPSRAVQLRWMISAPRSSRTWTTFRCREVPLTDDDRAVDAHLSVCGDRHD